MKLILLATFFLFLVSLTADARSRVLINSGGEVDSGVQLNEASVKCSVSNDEELWNGVLAAKDELHKQTFFSFDSVILINTENRKSSCEFLFDIFNKQEHIGQVEIVLSKNDWRKISRRIIKNNDTATW